MKRLTKRDLIEVNGGVDPDVNIEISLEAIIDGFRTVRSTIRSWGHTIGCLIWGGN